ncbi:hypothetical protein JYT51_00155 [Candidatus Amoebophilus asiaticus]|nr:hypothetical protein [Candidatus Amoebophilus asiaticus]
MITLRHHILVLAILLLFCAVAFAQTGHRNRSEKIEALKIAFITQKLDLTADEARSFWPVYNQYETELETIRHNRRKEKKERRKEFKDMSNLEIEKFLDNEIIFKEKELDIMKTYYVKFKQVLPIRKVAMLIRAQEDFKRELLRQLREKHQKGSHDKPPMKHR